MDSFSLDMVGTTWGQQAARKQASKRPASVGLFPLAGLGHVATEWCTVQPRRKWWCSRAARPGVHGADRKPLRVHGCPYVISSLKGALTTLPPDE